jgi:hypothetical protein
MAPIKFEENIREKLQERELQPNKDSWNELSKKLGHETASKSNRRLWMAVAAGFMGLLLVVSYVLTTVDEEQPIQLVDENNVIPSDVKEISESPRLEDNTLNNTPIIASENIKNDLDEPVKVPENKMIPNKDVTVTAAKEDQPQKKATAELIPLINKEAIAEVITDPKEMPNDKSTPTKEDVFVNNKVDAVVAEVRQMKELNNTVTAAEIDDLLSKAQRDIATNRILASSNKKIDPSALLQDIESEMERSFRDKVFEALGDGYNKVRTAVVERNN